MSRRGRDTVLKYTCQHDIGNCTWWPLECPETTVLAPGAAVWALFPLRVTARYVRAGEIETRYNHTHKSLALFFSPLYSLPFFLEERENWWPHTSTSAEWGRCLGHLFFLSKANPTNNNNEKMDQDWKEQHEKDFYYKVRTTLHLSALDIYLYARRKILWLFF